MRPASPSSESVTASVVPSGSANTSASMPRASAGGSAEDVADEGGHRGTRRARSVPTKVSPRISISAGSRHIGGERWAALDRAISPASTKPWRWYSVWFRGLVDSR